MASNSFGRHFTITTFGESHGTAIGVVVDGVPPGIAVSTADIQKELDRRKPGQSAVTTQRKEDDAAEVLSGIFEGKTTGAPIAIIVYNRNQQPKDYSNLKDVFRPGHADFTFQQKYGLRDYRGGGRQSGRETLARVAAGAIAKRLLAQEGVSITGFVRSVAGITANTIDYGQIEKNPVRCPDKVAAKGMEKAILAAKEDGDSLGGVVEIIAEGVPAGIGDPIFAKLDALLSYGLMTIGAVKGVEIGAGFSAAKMRGSASNDAFVKKKGKIVTATNHAGGISGGIANGMPIVARIAVKPPSSIAKEQQTVDSKGAKKTLFVKGRHDPCLCPRVVPVAEAMVALVIADALLAQRMVRH
ncbi:TPA: chorismate synthase [Candidatus Woesearchaeota archaeon]|nr:chorismate synthase [Candidatus Woesearchaeota archaeon]HII69561.1 chorismate synthase [Candidatus Woesearchaeota archaeon]